MKEALVCDAIRTPFGRYGGTLAIIREADLIIAGGVGSMSRAPFVLPKAESAFSRNTESSIQPLAGVSFWNVASRQLRSGSSSEGEHQSQ